MKYLQLSYQKRQLRNANSQYASSDSDSDTIPYSDEAMIESVKNTKHQRTSKAHRAQVKNVIKSIIKFL